MIVPGIQAVEFFETHITGLLAGDICWCRAFFKDLSCRILFKCTCFRDFSGCTCFRDFSGHSCCGVIFKCTCFRVFSWHVCCSGILKHGLRGDAGVAGQFFCWYGREHSCISREEQQGQKDRRKSVNSLVHFHNQYSCISVCDLRFQGFGLDSLRLAVSGLRIGFIVICGFRASDWISLYWFYHIS